MVVLYDYYTAQGRIYERWLKNNNIEYILEQDIDKIIALGYTQVPVLKINETSYDHFISQKFLL